MSVLTISLAIPTFNRNDVLFESFKEVYDDPRISSITIVDDASEIEIFEQVRQRSFGLPKIKLHRNLQNRDCYRNKYTALSLSDNDWNILLDSDNRIDKDYLDKIFAHQNLWDKNYILTPSFASPHFDFRKYEGLLVSKENVAEYIDKPMFETMLNAANFFVNKNEYTKVWDGEIDPVTSDSIYFCYKWLEAGKNIFVVPGLTYFHRVWDESHYQKNVGRTPAGFHADVLNKIRNLK